MKPFNLEAAKAGAPIVARDGREARFIAFVDELYEPNLKCLIVLVSGEKCCRGYFKDGTYWDGQGDSDSDSDLFMKPQKRTVWVNMYKDCCYNMKIGPLISARVFNTEREAKISGHDTGILAVAVPIEIEE